MQKLSLLDLKKYTAVTYEGAPAYDYSQNHPLIHLTFTFGAALFTDAYYESAQQQVLNYAKALIVASKVEPMFPWQYAAWMRDPTQGKGNRIQGSLAPAILDALLDQTEYTETYVARCLQHRPDDVTSFLMRYRELGLGTPSLAAKRGMAKALTHFDEYQLLKYARPDDDIRLCDAIYFVKEELTSLGGEASLALSIGRYLHSNNKERSRQLEEAPDSLPLSRARRKLFTLQKSDVSKASFAPLVASSRVTWEQVVGQFGCATGLSGDTLRNLKRLRSWLLPKFCVPSVWRLAFFTKTTLQNALNQLKGELKKEGEAKQMAESFLQKVSTKKKAWNLVRLTSFLGTPRNLKNDLTRTKAIADFAAEHPVVPYTTFSAIKEIYEALDPVLIPVRRAIKNFRNTTNASLDDLKQALTAIKLDAYTHPLLQEVSALLKTCSSAIEAESGAIEAAFGLHQKMQQLVHPPRVNATKLLEAPDNLRYPKKQSLEELQNSLSALLRSWKGIDEKLSAIEGESLAAPTAQRLLRLYRKVMLITKRTIESLRQDQQRLTAGDPKAHNNYVWDALLKAPGLFPDMAFLRNIRNLTHSGLTRDQLLQEAKKRAFRGVWPHQVYAGFQAEPALEPVFEAILQKLIGVLPKGKHLGIGDASGSMNCKVGGIKGTITCVDVAILFTAIMSQTSQLGASFSDGSWGANTKYLAIAERSKDEGILAFSKRPDLKAGMGGTQVFGAIIELIVWLKKNDRVRPPDCLWFFSDMQFHPATGEIKTLPEPIQKEAYALGLAQNRPPLELALDLYRRLFGHVDVVLWNLAAYAPVPVPAEMKGVLLVSGFDTNTFKQVEEWRQGRDLVAQQSVTESQEVVLDTIRRF